MVVSYERGTLVHKGRARDKLLADLGHAAGRDLVAAAHPWGIDPRRASPFYSPPAARALTSALRVTLESS